MFISTTLNAGAYFRGQKSDAERGREGERERERENPGTQQGNQQTVNCLAMTSPYFNIGGDSAIQYADQAHLISNNRFRRRQFGD